MKEFPKWTIEEVEDTFQIVLQKQPNLLPNWITLKAPLSIAEQEPLKYLQEKLLDHIWDWNEEELKAYFIIPLLELIGFDHNRYHPFLARKLIMTYHDQVIAGSVDFMVASGKRSPRRPYFFIQEYKKEHDASNDPLGQLMIAMVTARLLNNDGHPIYGAYVMGRYWHFVILDEKAYEVHLGFNAANDELKQIFGVLKNTREILDAWAEESQK